MAETPLSAWESTSLNHILDNMNHLEREDLDGDVDRSVLLAELSNIGDGIKNADV
jgi:hypothetical protein